MKKRLILFLLAIILASSLVQAESDVLFHVDTGVQLIKLSAAFLVIATILLMTLGTHLNETGKKIVFWTLTLAMIIPTFYFAASIINENMVSVTKGPIHWHLDYQVHVCGERLDLIDPKFPRNKIGTPLFHEHDDDRLHVEGTVMELQNVDLGEYFKVLGGELTQGYMRYVTNDGVVEVNDGDPCNGEPSTLKVYVNGNKIDNYQDFLPYPHAYVPPGDCAIIIFDSSDSPTTDMICESWAAQGWNYDNIERREITIGGMTWR